MTWRVTRIAGLALAALIASREPAVADAEGDTWTLTVDRQSARSEDPFGLAARNEAFAGEHGWIRTDSNGDFVRGDGTPIRFWCATTYVQTKRSLPELQAHVRALAVRGVNMLRHHGRINPERPEVPLQSINAREADGIQRLVATAKREGVYVTFSPYWANTARVPSVAWGLEGHAGGAPWGMLFFDKSLQNAYKAWLRQVLLRPNPYDAKGTPLARDPTLAIFQIQNEDSLLFGTAQQLGPAKNARLDAMYQAWRRAAGLPVGPALDIRFWNLDRAREDHLTGIRFLAETMRRWNAEVERFLREEIGYRGLINAGNWKTADNTRLLDLERWSYGANQVDAVNRYVLAGEHHNPANPKLAGSRILAGDIATDSPALLSPHQLPMLARQVAGRPFLVTESGWVAPAMYRAEGPLTVAAYSSLNRIDGFYWFRLHAVEYDASLDKWGSASPDVMGGWPAAALLYRRGDAKAGAPVVLEAKTRESMFSLRPAALTEQPGFDPNRDESPTRSVRSGGVDPLAYFVGPSLVTLDARRDELVVADLAPFIDRKRGRVRSNTGEIDLDWRNGVITVDTPRAQGAAGFLASRSPIALGTLSIETRTNYGSVVAVSLDDVPLADSRRVLLQVTTRARPTGWRSEPAARNAMAPRRFAPHRILNVGAAPWQVWRSDIEFRIANPRLSRACRVDPDLRIGRRVHVATDGKHAMLAVPSDAMYVVLESADLLHDERSCSGGP